MTTLRTSSTPVARLHAVSKHYGEVQALDGFDFELREGEVVALLGPNGAGKTTAVSILLGLLRADSGETEVFGGDPRDRAVRNRVGAMLQVSGVVPTLTVGEQIDLFRSFYPRPASLDSLVAAAGLDDLMDRRCDALSGGQRQRLMFALALAGDPELLFLDEPTAGLDLESRRRLWDNVRDVAAAGRTVLLTTHHLEEADALADRVVVIDRGRSIAEGTPAELASQVAGRRIRCVTILIPDVLSKLDGVQGVERRGAATDILTSEPEAVLRQLLALDPELRDLEVGGAGLEEAFLALTRDEAGSSSTANRKDRKERAA